MHGNLCRGIKRLSLVHLLPYGRKNCEKKVGGGGSKVVILYKRRINKKSMASTMWIIQSVQDWVRSPFPPAVRPLAPPTSLVIPLNKTPSKNVFMVIEKMYFYIFRYHKFHFITLVF